MAAKFKRCTENTITNKINTGAFAGGSFQSHRKKYIHKINHKYDGKGATLSILWGVRSKNANYCE